MHKKPLLTGLLLMVAGLLLFGDGASLIPLAQTNTREETGFINNENAFDEYVVTVEEAGTTIILDMTGNLDTTLYLLDSDNLTVAENDDRRPGDLTSRIEFENAAAGEYRVIATRYNDVNGDASGEYQLSIALQSPTPDAPYDVSDEALAALGFPPIDPRPTADWTIIGYYGGDTNLEPDVMKDFDEFEVAGGSNDNVRIVMMLDRHPEFADGSGNWRDTRLFEIQADVSGDDGIIYPPTLDTPELAQLGIVDTGQGEFLAQYMVWAMRQYPAENYALTFASHGAGWRGIIYDDSDTHTVISVPELDKALATVRDEIGFDKLNVLINDACLMSSIEYYAIVDEYFDLSFASPELVISPALDMTLFTEQLRGNPQADLAELGRTLADTYIQRDVPINADPADAQFYNSAITNLNVFDDVVQTVEDFAALVNSNPAVYIPQVSSVRPNTYAYGHFYYRDPKLIDLGNFMRRLMVESRDPDLIEAAQNVIDALDAARMYGTAGSDRLDQRIAYYNIYYPASNLEYDYLVESPLTNWGEMLRNHFRVMNVRAWDGDAGTLRFHPPLPPKLNITSVYPVDEASVIISPEFGFEVTGRNIAYIDAVYDLQEDDGTLTRLGNDRIITRRDGERLNLWPNGAELTTLIWDARLAVVTDGTQANNEYLTVTLGEEGDLVAFMDAQYREPDSDTFNDVTLVFAEEGPVVRVISRAADNADLVASVRIPEGSEVVALRSVVTSDGVTVQEPGNSYTWTGEGGLSWEWQPAPSGTYRVGFIAQSFGGATSYASTELVVNNDNVSGDLLSSPFIVFGTTLVRPLEIEEQMSFYFKPFVFVRGNTPDMTRNISLYLADEQDFGGTVPEDHDTIIDMVLDKYGLTETGERRSITADGVPVTEFDYEYTTEDGITYQGRAFARHINTIGFSPTLGVVHAAEQTTDRDGFEDFYALMRDNILLYDPLVASFDGAQWYSERLETLVYPMRAGWVPVESDEEAPVWTRYSEGGDPAAISFVAFANFEGEQTAQGLIDTYISAGADALTVEPDTRLYDNPTLDRNLPINLDWTATLYTAERDGVPVTGRLYTTAFELDGRFYAIWVEAPTAEAIPIYEETLELIVDGFRFLPAYITSLTEATDS